MVTRKKPIDPAESPKLILEGRIVTMNAAFKVMPRGRVFAMNGDIVAVQEIDQPVPDGFADVAVTETGGTIYPGLIDLHNHLPYNVLPLWQVPKKFSNRGQWARHDEYRVKVSAPMQTLAATENLLASICRYVECKALLGGTTTSQGITLANESGIRRYFKGVVRNVEDTDDDTLPEVTTRVPDVASRDVDAFMKRLKREKTCYLLHLSEGLDAVARRAFESLKISDDEWAITPALCGIHAAGLNRRDFDILAANGGSMVWSPFSNLLLYGGTADVAAAKAAGVAIALGCDWGPSGSRSLLGELKVAHLWSERDNIFTPRELVAMVTREAAGLLEWSPALGSIEAGKRADLLVISGDTGDPYLQLINAKENDVALVMINGVARVGIPALMRSLNLAGERIDVGGAARTLFLAHPNADPLVQGLSLTDATAALKAALRRLPQLARQADKPRPMSAIARMRDGGDKWRLQLDEIFDSGVDLRPNLGAPRASASMRPAAEANLKLADAVAPTEIDALTVAGDDEYFDALDQQLNLPTFIKSGLRERWA